VSGIATSELSARITEYSRGSDHPDLQVYRRDIDNHNWERFGWWISLIAELGHFYGDKRILEIGCGFGWEAAALSLETGATVVAMDILPSMIDGVQQCLDAGKARGETFSVEALVGDICTVDLPAGSFDGMFSSEAVEHVHSLEAMYVRCFELLKPGGRFVIANDSTAYNDEFRVRNMGMWPERDESWEHAEWLAAEVRPVEHAGAKPYGAMREEMIRAVQPQLSDDEMKKVVHATAGLIKPEIEQAAAKFVADGTLPVRPELSWCRNPETGEYAERLLDPFAMADGLKAAGFKVTLQHSFRRFPLTLLNHIGIRALNKLIFRKKALFLIVAEKPM
jgi:SAM-dependent methyltransferase